MGPSWLTALLMIPVLVLSCGEPAEDASPPTSRSAAENQDNLSAKELRAAQRREMRLAHCRRIRSLASVRYEIRSVPTPVGPEVRLSIVIDNDAARYLGGSTSGRLQLPPGPGFREIRWGGSSADVLGVERRTLHRRPIYHQSVRPGVHPVSDRVLWFDVETDLYDGKVSCEMPVGVTAPPGLVDGHPGGQWVIPADKSWRIGPDED
jgi:hypothetical protein